MGAIMTIGRLAWWRRRAPVVQLVQSFRMARTPVEQLALAELGRRERMPFTALVTSITGGLVAQEIGRGGSAVDIGISGPVILRAAVLRELQALEDVLWRYVQRPGRPTEPEDRVVASSGPRQARWRSPRLTLTT